MATTDVLKTVKTGIPAIDMWAGLWRVPDQLPFWARADDLANAWLAMARPFMWTAPLAPAAAPAPAAAVAAAEPRNYAPGITIDQMEVGQEARFTKVITQDDINDFARISGDANPVHLDAAYAEGTIFKGRIAHGILVSGLISAALGEQLPGNGTIYMSQSLRWIKPVLPGDELTAVITVKELIPEKNRAVLDTQVVRGEDVVLTGQALVMPPRG